MCEVITGREVGMDMEVMKDVRKEDGEEKKSLKEGSSSSVVRWERFLPRMVIRVLLVEADDSTRQIISALLRKCSYRVAAVSDGLKAWEVLKGRSHNIDLILTEADLPSISGFALLTLIMEHEICKNIPVIMMSSQDSISMVYKCMLRGAADFLVKPIRINELKNLWQHVWRRQSLSGGALGPKDESAVRQQIEATAENNAASNHSTGSKACAQKQEECVKKGSDAQSSCTRPDLEAESANMEEAEDLSQPNQNPLLVGNVKILNQGNSGNSGQKLFIRGSAIADSSIKGGAVEGQNQKELTDQCTVACNNAAVISNSSNEAINFIGAFGDHSRSGFGTSFLNNGAGSYESSQLDLSLRRRPLGGAENNANENQILNHSNASAFSRYVNKTLQPTCPTAAFICSIPKAGKTTFSDHLHDNAHVSDSNAKETKLSANRIHAEQAEALFPCPQRRLFPIQLPFGGSIRLDGLCTGYGSVTPTVLRASSDMQNPTVGTQQGSSSQMNSFRQLNLDMINSENNYSQLDQSPRISSNQRNGRQEKKSSGLEDRTCFSSPGDQSVSSILCNGGSQWCGSISGSNGNANASAARRTNSENGNEETCIARDGNSQRSIHREAALTKFRLKRKERCYEKKVRYESRKKLAEQRPRIKGQFVRQVPPDPPPTKSENSCGN
ncbi:hypothetical protein Ancab_010087 [Ancistrocladus abbreviatus]